MMIEEMLGVTAISRLMYFYTTQGSILKLCKFV